VEKNESDEFLKNVEQRYRGEKDERLIKTGFRNLDYSIDGFRKSEFVIIGGRPGAGKTTIGMNLAYQMAKDKNKVLFFSLEMGKIELHERLVKSITKITDYKKITEPEFEKIVRVSRAIKERLPLDVCDKPGITIEKIIYETKTRKPDVVFIDHLSILKSAKRFNSRYEEVSYLSARLKQLAREFDIPVVCLCQLNRALEGRELKAPTMADLRDSGSIEQDADIVCFVYRPEYHLKDKEPDDKNSKQYESWLEAMQEAKGKAQFILAKNRRGLLGRFDFGFDGATYTFYERDR
jgi:replicative DNA helicase